MRHTVYFLMINCLSCVHNCDDQSIIFTAYPILFYRQECFSGKYTTGKIHTKPHPGLGWRILVSCLSLKLYLISLVYDRNIFGSSSKVLGNLWKSSVILILHAATAPAVRGSQNLTVLQKRHDKSLFLRS